MEGFSSVFHCVDALWDEEEVQQAHVSWPEDQGIERDQKTG
jgi:hypothetical protein